MALTELDLYRDAEGHEVWAILAKADGRVLFDGIASDHDVTDMRADIEADPVAYGLALGPPTAP